MEGVHTNTLHYNYHYHTDLTIYKSGCPAALMDYFGDKILSRCAGIILAMFFLEVR